MIEEELEKSPVIPNRTYVKEGLFVLGVFCEQIMLARPHKAAQGFNHNIFNICFCFLFRG